MLRHPEPPTLRLSPLVCTQKRKSQYFDKLSPLLERLRDVGCARDKAGNRQLHFNQYCMLILLYLFNPIVTSLRGIQQASELANVQKKFGCPRASLGSLSEASTVFDAECLKQIMPGTFSAPRAS